MFRPAIPAGREIGGDRFAARGTFPVFPVRWWRVARGSKQLHRRRIILVVNHAEGRPEIRQRKDWCEETHGAGLIGRVVPHKIGNASFVENRLKQTDQGAVGTAEDFSHVGVVLIPDVAVGGCLRGRGPRLGRDVDVLLDQLGYPSQKHRANQ